MSIRPPAIKADPEQRTPVVRHTTQQHKRLAGHVPKKTDDLLTFCGPNIALILLFIYYPLIANIRYSLLNWRLGSDTATLSAWRITQFFTSETGLEVRVTIIFTVAVVGSMVLGLLQPWC